MCQRYATVGNAEPTTVVVPKKPRTLRKILIYTTLGTATFYVGSAFLAFNNKPYYDFFVENVPLGTSFIQFAEENDWDEVDSDTILNAGTQVVDGVQSLYSRFVSGTAGAAKTTKDAVSAKAESAKDAAAAKVQSARDTTVAKTQAAKDAATGKPQTVTEAAVGKAQSVKAAVSEAVEHSKERAKAVAGRVITQIEKTEGKVEAVGKDSAASVKHQMGQFSSEIQDLVDQAEHVLAGKPINDLLKNTAATVEEKVTATASNGKVYDAPLPLGHEPPPGFSKPKAAVPKPASTSGSTLAQASEPSAPTPAPPPLPLVAPAVADLSASEPVIAQLAGTIDGLASFLNANPTAADKARDILDTAKVDLTALAGRIDKVKADERARLEAELDAQAHEYNHKLLTLEMEAQDKLDHQEVDFKKILDEERSKMVKAYREKLEHELQTQSEIINERYVFAFFACVH